ncbi:sulfur carrier protein ThiS [Streptomonospora nanhaiensis]|uniref:Sulfur carrier protein n=1 Tax=Streptomonospora nanhaiensis TaxID=1323731 RepID=A0A853BHQ6_9ACTN|nr:sulfur carrier protein ThiS [Streptomonospora nanhaiensis]MBV2362424.1 sulfur carrier protein ThiS [Streptomonospora nanhaiensis]MBX9389187.1 sulfur carrier protein ThiS [Streptomonospora nanhaiensis]NYI94919.1 sulfur carrier protein [Streptomonospora nanhaiensis]
MDVIINGEPRQVAPRTTVAEVVRTLTRSPGGVAVALNDEVVRRADWAATVVAENDRIDVLTAVQGG